MRRRIFYLLLSACLVAWYARHPERWRPHSSQPNIVLITLDTFRADSLSYAGNTHANTPHLDALARRGILFEQARSQCDRTAQSHMSLLSSRYWSQTNGPERVLLAQALQARGYHTGAVVSSALLNPEVGMAREGGGPHFGQGFDDYEELRPSTARVAAGDHSVVMCRERTGYEVSRLACTWLDAQSRATDGRPWFLWLHYYTCHGQRHPVTGQLMTYSQGVECLDGQLGQVTEHLRTLGDQDRTIVAVTADHGESLGQHDFVAHAGLYDAILRVPMIIAAPSGPHGQRSQRSVANVDLAATLLGAPLPEGHGRVLLELPGVAATKRASSSGSARSIAAQLLPAEVPLLGPSPTPTPLSSSTVWSGSLPTHTLAADQADALTVLPREGAAINTASDIFGETRDLQARCVISDRYKYIEYDADLCEPVDQYAAAVALRTGRDVNELLRHREQLHWGFGLRPDDRNLAIYRPAGLRELFDLRADPNELHNLASAQPERVGRMRAKLEKRFGHTTRQQLLDQMRKVGY
jgi:arylsulfatase A-like enzyme